jgi:hypothetical protein
VPKTARIVTSMMNIWLVRRFDVGIVPHRVPVAGAFSANPLIPRNITLPLVVA